MDILTFFTPGEIDGLDNDADVVIVFDVLRGTTTVTQAFKAGAAKIIPVAEPEEAFKAAEKLERDKVIIGGGFDNIPIENFNLGDSPLEYTPEVIGGKILVYYSINTVKALNVSRNADRVLLACFNNIQAVIESVGYPSRIYLLCSGRMGRFSFEDAVCAGMFVQRLIDSYSGEVGLNDAAATSRYIYYRHHRNILNMLEKSSQGNYLTKNNKTQDLEFAAQIDSTNIVPELSLDKTHLLPTVALENAY